MILYFSATGNTKWAAIKVAQITQDNLVYIPEALKDNQYKYELAEDERLGIIFPVHGWRVPIIVREYLKKLELTTSDGTPWRGYTYSICTAGDSIGKAFKYMPLKVDSAWSLIMPEAYVGLPFMDVDPKEKEMQKRAQAEKDLQSICEEVYDRKKGIFRLTEGPIPGFFSGPVGGFFEKHLITDKPFYVEADRCVKCGICANVCPVDNVIGGKGQKPEWKKEGNCLVCFNCYHHCPHHAIEYGKRTKHKGQYYYR